MNRRNLILGLGMCLLLTACNSTDSEIKKPGSSCHSEEDKSFCAQMASSVMTCHQGKWVETPCVDGKCVYTAEGAVCQSTENCQEGERLCASKSLAKECVNGAWTYHNCATGLSCEAGQCSQIIEEDEVFDHLISRRCTDDKLGVIETYTDKELTITCLDEVGFASTCKQFSNEQAGCVLPQVCDDVFSKAGTCFGDNLAFCEVERIEPAPAVLDCAHIGKTCAQLDGVAYCLDRCTEAGELSCVKTDGIERASRCVDVDGKLVLETRMNLCKDEKTSVRCANGKMLEMPCEGDARCIPEFGACADFCTASELGKAKCTDAGIMTQCQKHGDTHRYINVGMRHCNGDILQTCVKKDDVYSLKESNCRTYTDPDSGKLIEGRCVLDYQYSGFDVCVPVIKGPPCEGITSDGVCDGSELYVCEEADDALWKRECKDDIDGMTSCTKFMDYADCRRPCMVKGKASCYKSGGGDHNILLCAPDDETGVLSEIEGTGICLDGILHSCTNAGAAITTDCQVRGGICSVKECAFAACPIDVEAKCAGPKGNLVLGCETYENGLVIGYTLSQTYCQNKDNCYSCKNGLLKKL